MLRSDVKVRTLAANYKKTQLNEHLSFQAGFSSSDVDFYTEIIVNKNSIVRTELKVDQEKAQQQYFLFRNMQNHQCSLISFQVSSHFMTSFHFTMM